MWIILFGMNHLAQADVIRRGLRSRPRVAGLSHRPVVVADGGGYVNLYLWPQGIRVFFTRRSIRRTEQSFGRRPPGGELDPPGRDARARPDGSASSSRWLSAQAGLCLSLPPRRAAKTPGSPAPALLRTRDDPRRTTLDSEPPKAVSQYSEAVCGCDDSDGEVLKDCNASLVSITHRT